MVSNKIRPSDNPTRINAKFYFELNYAKNKASSSSSNAWIWMLTIFAAGFIIALLIQHFSITDILQIVFKTLWNKVFQQFQ